jgi:hypothetical protein
LPKPSLFVQILFAQREGWPTPFSPPRSRPELRFILPGFASLNYRQGVRAAALRPNFFGRQFVEKPIGGIFTIVKGISPANNLLPDITFLPLARV